MWIVTRHAPQKVVGLVARIRVHLLARRVVHGVALDVQAPAIAAKRALQFDLWLIDVLNALAIVGPRNGTRIRIDRHRIAAIVGAAPIVLRFGTVDWRRRLVGSIVAPLVRRQLRVRAQRRIDILSQVRRQTHDAVWVSDRRFFFGRDCRALLLLLLTRHAQRKSARLRQLCASGCGWQCRFLCALHRVFSSAAPSALSVALFYDGCDGERSANTNRCSDNTNFGAFDIGSQENIFLESQLAPGNNKCINI